MDFDLFLVDKKTISLPILATALLLSRMSPPRYVLSAEKSHTAMRQLFSWKESSIS